MRVGNLVTKTNGAFQSSPSENKSVFSCNFRAERVKNRETAVHDDISNDVQKDPHQECCPQNALRIGENFKILDLRILLYFAILFLEIGRMIFYY